MLKCPANGPTNDLRSRIPQQPDGMPSMRLVGHSRRCWRSGEMPYVQKRCQSSKAEGLRQFAPSLSASFEGGLQSRMDHRPENRRAASNRNFLQKHREFAVSISELESKIPLIFTRCHPTRRYRLGINFRNAFHSTASSRRWWRGAGPRAYRPRKVGSPNSAF